MNPALAELRDIHLPAEPGWWPPGPGWWFTAVMLLLLTGIALYGFHRKYQSGRYRRAALQSLQQMEQDTGHAIPVAALNALLKRAALTAFPQGSTAMLAGDDWVAFLQRSARLAGSDEAALRMLAETPYRDPRETANAALITASRNWLRKHR